MRVAVIGGGIFGCCTAFTLAEGGFSVDLYEPNELMSAASKHNHARVHLGYHYPRSDETTEQCLDGMESFRHAFGHGLLAAFPKYYAISKGSYTSPDEFEDFCERHDLPFSLAWPAKEILSRNDILACYQVREAAFDITTLRWIVLRRLNTAGVKWKRETVSSVTREHVVNGHQYDAVVNATYANINYINKLVGVAPIQLNFENVRIPHVKYNHGPIGVTVLDGPFGGIMPAGFTPNHFLVYHVVASVDGRTPESIVYAVGEWFPFLEHAEITGCYETVRATIRNPDDARLSLVMQPFPNHFTLFSGKVVTCMTAAEKVRDACYRLSDCVPQGLNGAVDR